MLGAGCCGLVKGLGCFREESQIAQVGVSVLLQSIASIGWVVWVGGAHNWVIAGISFKKKSLGTKNWCAACGFGMTQLIDTR